MITLSEHIKAGYDEGSSYVVQMASLYGIDRTKLPVETLLVDGKLTADKGEVNKHISEFMETFAVDITNGVKHRLHENRDKLEGRTALKYPVLISDIKKNRSSINSNLSSVKELQERMFNHNKRVKELHAEIEKAESTKEEALLADLCGSESSNELLDMFAKAAEGGKFIYSHSVTTTYAIEHYFAFDHEVILEDRHGDPVEMGKYFFKILMNKDNTPRTIDFGEQVVVYGLTDYYYETNIHPHVSGGYICWGSVYDSVREDYSNCNYEGFFDTLFAWFTQWNPDDAYASINHIIDESGVRNETTDTQGKIVLANLRKSYTTEAPSIVKEDSGRTTLIKSFITESIALKRAGKRVQSGDIIYVGTELKFMYCIGRALDKVTAIPLEELNKGLTKTILDEADVYSVPTPPANMFKVFKNYVDTHGIEWHAGDKYSRKDKEDKAVEGKVLAIYHEYKTTSGALATLVILETDRKLIALAPDLNNFETINLTKKAKEDEQKEQSLPETTPVRTIEPL